MLYDRKKIKLVKGNFDMIIIQLSTVTEFDVERATRMVIIFLKKIFFG